MPVIINGVFEYKNRRYEIGYMSSLDRSVVFLDDDLAENIKIVYWSFGSYPDGIKVPEDILKAIDKEVEMKEEIDEDIDEDIEKFTADELRIARDPVLALAYAVVKQWIFDGRPKSDITGVQPWVDLLKERLASK